MPIKYKRTTPRHTIVQAARTAQVSRVLSLLLNAYETDSDYAIVPPDFGKFQDLVETTQEFIDIGVPDTTTAGELSAVNKYWRPFCKEYGIPFLRPPYSSLSGDQQKAEDVLRAACLPFIHSNMKGKKQAVAQPSSAMSALRNITRWIDRDNDERNMLVKPLRVLKGMLTQFVADYGPIRPDQSLPLPTPVINALLSIPSGTLLGSYTLNWTSGEGKHLRAMLETGLQSGIRLDEATVGRSHKWDKRKMSRRSLSWRINGQIFASPSPAQLSNLSEATRDGAILLPACSKCDQFGNKHGDKIMFFPFQSSHSYNACTALRDLELHRPIVDLQTRGSTPLFTLEDGSPFPASRVRSILYHAFRHESVRAATPAYHTGPGNSPRYTFHSFRKTFATCLRAAGADRPRIQSMVRWLSEEAVDIYDKLSMDDHADYVEAAYLHNALAVTPAAMADIQIDDNNLYQAWCDRCSVVIDSFTPDF